MNVAAISRVVPRIALGCLLAWAAGAQTLTATRTVVSPITNFHLSYIDVTGRGTGPQLFTLVLTPPVPSDPNALFQIEFSAVCSTNVVSGEVYHGESGTFALTGPLVLTSNEFFADRGADAPSLTRTSQSLSDEEAQRIFLSAGIVPSGRIYLRFTLYRVDGGRVPAGTGSTVVLDIVAIRYVKLISPGGDASFRLAEVPESFSLFPQFLWSSDLMPVPYAPGAVKFVVSVYENPDNTYSLAELPETRPVWVYEVDGTTNANYAQYPVSGARALEPGRTYYWQVRAVLQGPENREIASEIYAFRVTDHQFSLALSPRQKLILGYLRAILGDNYGYVMRELEEMLPTESVVIDGREVDLSELAALARRFAAGELAAGSVHVE